MFDCIERLLKQENDEENLECLCLLLTTTGRELDKPAITIQMNEYFAKLTEITKKGSHSIGGRIRFIILDVIELRQNKWIPSQPYVGSKKIDEIRNEILNENNKIISQVRSILNKLTLQNLDKLATQLVRLEINTEERLDIVVDIIYERSINEKLLSQVYAQLCRVLSRKIPVNLNAILLTKCQKEFNRDFIEDVNYDQMIDDTEAKPEKANKIKMRNEQLLHRSLGNIQFIGELFKSNIHTVDIMNDYIEKLIQQDFNKRNLLLYQYDQ
jgi:hypothetical protein